MFGTLFRDLRWSFTLFRLGATALNPLAPLETRYEAVSSALDQIDTMTAWPAYLMDRDLCRAQMLLLKGNSLCLLAEAQRKDELGAARACVEEALPILRAHAKSGRAAASALRNPDSCAQALARSGRLLFVQAREADETAIEALELALELWPDAPRAHMAYCLHLLAVLYLDRAQGSRDQNVERASAYAEHGLAILADRRPASLWGLLTAAKCRALVSAPDTDKATIEHARSRAEDALRSLDPDVAGDGYKALRQFLIVTEVNAGAGDRHSAVDLARQHLTSESHDESSPAWAHAAFRLASALHNHLEGDRAASLDEAQSLLERALTIARRTGDARLEAHCQQLMASVTEHSPEPRSAAEMEAAIALRADALERLDQRTDPEAWALRALDQAEAYLDRGEGYPSDNAEMALALAEQAALRTYRAAPQVRLRTHAILGEALSARVYGDRRTNLSRALREFSKALDVAEGAGDTKKQVDLRARIEHGVQALAHAETNSCRSEPRERHEAGEDAVATLDQQAATLEKEREALVEQAEAIGDPSAVRTSRIVLAQSLMERAVLAFLTAQDGDRARALLWKAIDQTKQARRATRKTIEPRAARDIADMLARAYELQYTVAESARLRPRHETAPAAIEASPPPEVVILLDQAIGHAREALALNDAAAPPRDRLVLLVHLAELLVARRCWREASDLFEEAIRLANAVVLAPDSTSSDYRSALETLAGMSELAPFAALMEDCPIAALRLIEETRTRLLTRALGIRAFPMSEEQRARLEGLTADLTARVRRLTDDPHLIHRRPVIEEIVGIRDAIGELIGDLPGRIGSDEDVAGRLDAMARDGTDLLAFSLCRYGGRTVTFQAGRPEEGPTVDETGDRRALAEIFGSREGDRPGTWLNHYKAYHSAIIHRKLTEARVEAWSAAIGDTADRFADFARPSLDRLGAEPAPCGKPRRLRIIADGPAGVLPLGLLPVGQGHRLIDRHVVSMLPSFQLLEPALRDRDGPAAPPSAAVLSEAGAEDSTIPFAGVEFEFLASRMRVERIDATTAVASGDDVFEKLNGRDIWHVASHGSFVPHDPSQSQLSYGEDRSVTLGDLLAAPGLTPPRLVVLAACESGLHDVDRLPSELIGFPTAFHQLGAISVVATLWPVIDFATALLMGRFYDRALDAGDATDVALRDAELWLRDATADDLYRAVEDWQQRCILGEKTVQSFRQKLARFHSCALGQRAFAGLAYWGAFCHYGAGSVFARAD